MGLVQESVIEPGLVEESLDQSDWNCERYD